jgi:hypothetical protein
MEALVAASSVAALLELSFKTFGYIIAVYGANDDRKRLREETGACSRVLLELQDVSTNAEGDHTWVEMIRSLTQPDGPIQRLQLLLGLVEKKIRPKDGLREALKWPFKKKEVQKLVETIEREKNTLSTIRQYNSEKILHRVKMRSKETSAKFTDLLQTLEFSMRDNQRHHQALVQSVNDVSKGIAENGALTTGKSGVE